MLQIRPLLCAFLLLAVAACGPSKPKGPAAPQQPGAAVRLPGGVTPVRYDIAIVPDAQRMAFSGQVRIAVQVLRPTRTIVLNAKDLSLDRVSLDGRPARSVALDAAAQTATLTFDDRQQAGAHVLDIAYRGKINGYSSGLFALDYDTADGPRRMLATQLESADARRFVPCWDEPALKAVFQMTVTAPEAQLAVSNTPQASSRPLGNGLKQVVFQPTPKMSSYLLFLGMGDLERVSRNVDGVDVGVVVRRGAGEKARYALDRADELLRYYNDYFGIRYPLPKLDLIGAPGAGGFGAMENWGAILFFENRVLADPKLSTEGDRQTVAVYIAHEMAHQWFGDLVTMAWWDDLWLNESFANWMEAKALDHLHPDWGIRLWEARGREDAMQLDASSATHPIVQPAESLEQVNEIGDAIVYDKGAAVVRMLEGFVGEDAWREGVRAYMRRHQYGNATRADLWAEIEAASKGKPVTRIARDFTEQAGLPMIRAEIMAGQSPGSALLLNQARFAADDASNAARSWRIPVLAQAVGGGPVTQTIVRGGPLIQALHNPRPGPLVVNPGQVGYFRTHYSPSAFLALSERFARVAPADQLGMLADSWALAEAGYAPAANFLVLGDRLPADADPRVWVQALATLGRIDRLYDGLPGQAAFRAWARSRLTPVLARAGWQASSRSADTRAVLRAALIGALGEFDDPATTAEARARFGRFLKDPSSLGPDIRQAVLGVVGRQADAATFETLRRLAREARDPQEKRQFLEALAQVRDPRLAGQALSLALSGEVPVTLSPVVIRIVAAEHPDLAWTFAQSHEAAINARLDPSQRLSFIPGLLASSSSEQRADELQVYAARTYPAGGRRESGKVEAGVRERADVRRLRLPEVDRWLQARGH